MIGEIVWSSDGSCSDVVGTTPHAVMIVTTDKNAYRKFLKTILASLPEFRKNFFGYPRKLSRIFKIQIFVAADLGSYKKR